MSKSSRYQRAKKQILDIENNPSRYLIVHYSCEGFDIEGRTPRIISIAVHSIKAAQVTSFSIHKIAEKQGIPFDKVIEKYNEIERFMLDDFFSYLKKNSDYIWLHWNMRDINYGFQAIEHRYEVLGGSPFVLDNDKKMDISRLFADKYGMNYAPHNRIANLLKMNGMEFRDFLSGKEEVDAFNRKEFVRLHASTLRKVMVFNHFLRRSAQEDLKTNAKWRDIHDSTPQGLYLYLKEHWLWALFIWLSTLVLGGLVGLFIQTALQ